MFENASVYDNDGDGKNDIYLFTPIIPEKFTSEDVVHVWAGDYDKNLSSSYVSCAHFNTPHWYCGEGYGEFIVYKVTVAEAGIYEMAIHTRLKDTKERGAKYTVNEGTANEYSFETSFQFATDEEMYAARENDYTMSSFMYGIYLNLEAGDNYIKIEESSKSPKSQHFRDFYFVKVADLTPHEHEIVDGKCECGFIPVFENASVYDNDGDGKNDVYLFTPILPEKFTGEDAVHVWAGDYDRSLSSSYVDIDSFDPIRSWCCPEGTGEYYTYKVTVSEAGIYEMAIHTRLWDTKARGAKFTVNKDTENEYTFELSYQFATETEVNAARENDYTRSSYIYNVKFELQAGDNYIRIDEPTQELRALRFRDFYFVKVGDSCTEHTWGEWVTVTEPNCEEDGLQKRTCTKCYASEEAPIDDLDGHHVWGNIQVVQKPVSCVEPGIERYTCSKCNATKDIPVTDTKLHIWGEPILENEITCTQSSDGIKLCTKCGESIKVHVFAQGHKWGEWNVLSDVPCGQTGSQRSHTCQVCGKTETLSDGRTYHVWGNPVEVTAPTCTQSGKAIKTCTICGSESAEEIFRKDHVYENGICTSCGRAEGYVETFEKTSGYDSDGDGANDVYFFTPVLPERFEGEDAIHLWMDEYEKDLSSNYVPESMFSGNYNHVYFDEGQGQYAVYKITVAEAGVYEMAIHTRLKDTYERGGKYTVNEGTEYEYSFETSFQFATDEEVYAARENEYTMSSYMYGMYLELQEGDNYIKIELSSGGEKSMHWREFFFVKVEQ